MEKLILNSCIRFSFCIIGDMNFIFKFYINCSNVEKLFGVLSSQRLKKKKFSQYSRVVFLEDLKYPVDVLTRVSRISFGNLCLRIVYNLEKVRWKMPVRSGGYQLSVLESKEMLLHRANRPITFQWVNHRTKTVNSWGAVMQRSPPGIRSHCSAILSPVTGLPSFDFCLICFRIVDPRTKV